jgi:hypothetical protein
MTRFVGLYVSHPPQGTLRAAASVKASKVAQAQNRFEPSAPDSVRRVWQPRAFPGVVVE